MSTSSTVPPNYAKCTQAGLEYAYWRTPDNEEVQMEWQKLENPHTVHETPPQSALLLVTIDKSGLQLVQSTGKDIKCTLSWSPGEYGACEFRERETTDTDVFMVFTPSEPPVIECDEAAKEFPLARLFDTSAPNKKIRIRLSLNTNRVKPMIWTRSQFIKGLIDLTSGFNTGTNENDESPFVMSMKTISLKEAKEQATLTAAAGQSCRNATNASPAPAIRPNPAQNTSSIGHNRQSSMQAILPQTTPNHPQHIRQSSSSKSHTRQSSGQAFVPTNPLTGAAHIIQSSTSLAQESAILEREEKIQRLAEIRAEAADEEEEVWARAEAEIAEIKRRGRAEIAEIKRREQAKIEELL